MIVFLFGRPVTVLCCLCCFYTATPGQTKEALKANCKCYKIIKHYFKMLHLVVS